MREVSCQFEKQVVHGKPWAPQVVHVVPFEQLPSRCSGPRAQTSQSVAQSTAVLQVVEHISARAGEVKESPATRVMKRAAGKSHFRSMGYLLLKEWMDETVVSI